MFKFEAGYFSYPLFQIILKWHWKWPSFEFDHFCNVNFDIATGYFDILKKPGIRTEWLNK